MAKMTRKKIEEDIRDKIERIEVIEMFITGISVATKDDSLLYEVEKSVNEIRSYLYAQLANLGGKR